MSTGALRARRIGEPPVSDAVLMQRLVTGDLGALGDLHDRYYRDVLGVVLRCGIAPGEADDAAQETFLKVLDLAPRYDGRESARPWIYGVAWRVTVRRRRWTARWLRALSTFAHERSGDHASSPEEQVIADERTRSFMATLDRLPEKMRSVLVLVEIGGLTGDEAAKALGIPASTVWTRLHYARKRLQEIIATGDDHER